MRRQGQYVWFRLRHRELSSAERQRGPLDVIPLEQSAETGFSRSKPDRFSLRYQGVY